MTSLEIILYVACGANLGLTIFVAFWLWVDFRRLENEVMRLESGIDALGRDYLTVRADLREKIPLDDGAKVS